MESNFRILLKSETLEEHKSLEAASRIMRPEFTFEDYGDILERWFAFYSVFETMLDENEGLYPEIHEMMSDRRKRAHLKLDLQSLNRSIQIPAETETEVRRFLTPLLKTRAQLWGALYVLEGSTLGAQFITKHLTNRFEIGAEQGVLFYRGYGERTGPLWKAFVHALEDLVLSADEIESGVESARAMFKFFGKFLEPKSKATRGVAPTV